MGRIAALEEQLAAVLRRLDALEGAPPKRSPASATGGSFTIRNTPQQATAFGFGLPGAYIGGAPVDEDVRDERWRDAQT